MSDTRFGGNVTNDNFSQCINCNHARPQGKCPAFPDGVPIIILTNEHDHHKPYAGDNGIQFEPIPHTTSRQDGGAGSGNFHHAGRPGEVGGSGEGGSSNDKKTLEKSNEKKYTSRESEAQHGAEGTEGTAVVSGGTSASGGPEDRGGNSSSGQEHAGIDVRGSIGNGGRVVATHHTEDGDVYEFDNPQFNHDNLRQLKSEHKYGSSVTLHTPEEYSQARTFIAKDGRAGFTITKDGDLQSVIKMNDSSLRSDTMLSLAIKQGARTLDCFDTVLPHVYKAHGFKEINRIKWDDQYKPKDWDYDLYKKYNNGRPDVVFMKREE